MHKVFNDYRNTIDSVEWRHKGYTVWMNPSPTACQSSTGIWKSNYLIARPEEDSSFCEAHTLAEAKDTIEEDLTSR